MTPPPTRRPRAKRRLLFASFALGAWWWSSCAPSGFQDIALIQNGIRILASGASKPYANPGDTVAIQVLAYDGRSAAQRDGGAAMQIYWLPFLCKDPPQDAYYSCFPQFASAQASLQGQGADGGGIIGEIGSSSIDP